MKTTYQQLVGIYFEEFAAKKKFPPSFGGVEGKMMKGILEKLKQKYSVVKSEDTSEELFVVDCFRFMLQNIENMPQWYKENGWDLRVLNSKFDIIFESAFLKRNYGKNSGITEDFRAKVCRSLEGL